MSKNYKPTLEWFKGRMDAKLGLPKNLRKRTWRKDTDRDLFRRLGEESRELSEALDFKAIALYREDVTPEKIERIIDEAADVANFAMMIADNAQRFFKKYGKKPTPSHGGGSNR